MTIGERAGHDLVSLLATISGVGGRYLLCWPRCVR
jgi:hypothetical protein